MWYMPQRVESGERGQGFGFGVCLKQSQDLKAVHGTCSLVEATSCPFLAVFEKLIC